MRTDKRKNVDKVAAELVKTPLATEQEIADRAGLGQRTVSRAKVELAKDGNLFERDNRIQHLCDLDFELVYKAGRELLKRVEEDPDKIGTGDLTRIADLSGKRYMLMKGDATDVNGGLKKLQIEIVNS